MTSIVILPIAVREVEIGYRWRVIVVVTTKVLRWRICERRDIKGIVVMVRLSKLVHVGIMRLCRVKMRQEWGVEFAVNAKAFYLCGRQ